MSFSLITGLIFGAVSALAGFLFVTEPHGEGWEFLWISTGTGGFITGFSISKLLVVTPNNYTYSRLLTSGLMIGIVSHWVHWYISLVAIYVNVQFFGAYMFGEPIDPLNALLASIQLSFMSLIFYGWTAIPLAIVTLFLTKRIKLNALKQSKMSSEYP